MPTYPTGPQLLKGALITFSDETATGNVIPLQYNPSTLSRTFQPQYTGGEQDNRSDWIRFEGAPIETISLTAQIDAIDLMEAGSKQKTPPPGILPQLAALELLVSPSVAVLTSTLRKLQQGTIEIVPAAAPITVFVFGAHRIVPVRVDSISVTEETHDNALNPIRAQVVLSMRVLTVSDQDPNSPGARLFLAYLSGKEQLAKNATVNRLDGVLPASPADSLDELESL